MNITPLLPNIAIHDLIVGAETPTCYDFYHINHDKNYDIAALISWHKRL